MCGRIVLRAGAKRLSMVPPPKELFLEAVTKVCLLSLLRLLPHAAHGVRAADALSAALALLHLGFWPCCALVVHSCPTAGFPPPPAQVVEANADWVPPQGKGSLYLRPLLIGSGPILGLGPAPAYTLVRAAGRGACCRWGACCHTWCVQPPHTSRSRCCAAAATPALAIACCTSSAANVACAVSALHVVCCASVLFCISQSSSCYPELTAGVTPMDPCTSVNLFGPQVVYCASVGSYFKGGQLTPIDLIVENHFHR